MPTTQTLNTDLLLAGLPPRDRNTSGSVPHRGYNNVLLAILVLALLFLSACNDRSLSVGNSDSGESDSNGPVTGTAEPNPPVADLAVIDEAGRDDFEVNTLNQWSLRNQTEGTRAQYSLLDINQTTTGALTIIPNLTHGWFAGADAPLIYRLVDGNFAVETYVTVTGSADITSPPTADFNSAGLMARNPQGKTDPENYIMVNLGRQDNSIAFSIGTEHKSTTNSISILELRSGTHSGRLLLCRVGDVFRSFRYLDNETGWTILRSETRSDLPTRLQVGMVTTAFTGPDNKSVFDYISLRKPDTLAQCLP